jgi:hypothetical protein
MLACLLAYSGVLAFFPSSGLMTNALMHAPGECKGSSACLCVACGQSEDRRCRQKAEGKGGQRTESYFSDFATVSLFRRATGSRTFLHLI